MLLSVSTTTVNYVIWINCNGPFLVKLLTWIVSQILIACREASNIAETMYNRLIGLLYWHQIFVLDI